jgi:hypothetical protein
MAYGFGAGVGYGTGNDFLVTNYFSNPSKQTLFAWAKLPVDSTNYSSQAVFCKFTGNNSENVGILRAGAEWNIAVYIPGAAGVEYDVWFKIPAGIDPTAGIFFAVVWDQAETFISQKHPKVFVNGQECVDKLVRVLPPINSAPSSTDTSAAWQIGRRKHSFGMDYSKFIAGEVAIWNTLLTDAQCVDLTAGKAPNKYTTGLQIYYPLATDAIEWVSLAAATATGAILRASPPPTVVQAVNPVRPTPPPAPDPTKLISLFLGGNSITDEIKGDDQAGLPALISQGDRTAVIGRHVIPGAPLDYLYANATGFTTEPYGASRNALQNYDWKFVSFQPFDRQLTQDTAQIGLFIVDALTRPANANCEYFVYGRTPRRLTAGTWVASAYKSRWDRVYLDTNPDQPEESRDYFQKLTTAVRTANPARKISLVPVGEVFYQLNEQAIAGTLTGITSAWDFYDKLDGSGALDTIHLTNYGSYIVALTFYAMTTKLTPVGVTPTDAYKINGVAMSATLATAIQQTVKSVILAASIYTGITTFDPVVPPTPTPTPTPSPGGTIFIDRTRNPYPLHNVYPGQSRIIQLFNPDGTVYVIPVGSVIQSKVVSVVGELIADLGAAVFDAATGLIKLTLPDTPQVRKFVGGHGVYDIAITLASSNIKYLPPSTLEIARSPTKFSFV